MLLYGQRTSRAWSLLLAILFCYVAGCSAQRDQDPGMQLGKTARALTAVRIPPIVKGPIRDSFNPQFTWKMADRFSEAEAAYLEDRIAEYARPAVYKTSFDACASSAGSGATYTWLVSAVTGSYVQSVVGSACTLSGHALPALGDYDVTLRIRRASGAEGTITSRITLRDSVILSIGDSLAAGEGNPDSPGYLYDPVHTADDPEWWESDCHRSLFSPHAIAARAIEASDPHSSVTYLAFACTGAEVFGGVLGEQPGRLGHQITRAMHALCDPNSCRPVDKAFLSVGVNDIGFSTILEECVLPNRTGDGCHPASDMIIGFQELRDRYAALDTALRGRLLFKRVYVGEYPEDLAGGGGCGAMLLVSSAESQRIVATAGTLNGVIKAASLRHGWTYVGGVAEAFRGHGYCSGDSWFRDLSTSFADQDDYMGTAHPDSEGREAVAARILAAVNAPPPPAERELDVTLERVLVTYDGRHGGLGPQGASAGIVPGLETQLVATGTVGQWRVPVASGRTRRVRVRDELRIQGFANMTASQLVGTHPHTGEKYYETNDIGLAGSVMHGPSDNFGVGSLRTLSETRDGASFTIEYRITDAAPEQEFDVTLERVRIDYDGTHGAVAYPGVNGGITPGSAAAMPAAGAVNTWLVPAASARSRRIRAREQFVVRTFGTLIAHDIVGRHPTTNEPEIETFEVGITGTKAHTVSDNFGAGQLHTLTQSKDGVTLTVEYRVAKVPPLTVVIGTPLTNVAR